ncbi:UNKNOWN [Stylonychia lemnae]|uniref:Uncharacterized protein n=1 Tax=Stylonychia lemnae TaxID=5949 RepID=A0A077ZWJ2_STYLE|nr:UNKNOWN [Stylonychia lemnae]|eukprot:CDW72816.1 UNKNOWN [Stylonychia lemnae]
MNSSVILRKKARVKNLLKTVVAVVLTLIQAAPRMQIETDKLAQSSNQEGSQCMIIVLILHQLLDDQGKVNFKYLKYNSSELFEKLPIFDEAMMNFNVDEFRDPWTKLAKAIVSPYSNFRFHLEIAKQNFKKQEQLPFFYPHKNFNKEDNSRRESNLEFLAGFGGILQVQHNNNGKRSTSNQNPQSKLIFQNYGSNNGMNQRQSTMYQQNLIQNQMSNNSNSTNYQQTNQGNKSKYLMKYLTQATGRAEQNQYLQRHSTSLIKNNSNQDISSMNAIFEQIPEVDTKNVSSDDSSESGKKSSSSNEPQESIPIIGNPTQFEPMLQQKVSIQSNLNFSKTPRLDFKKIINQFDEQQQKLSPLKQRISQMNQFKINQINTQRNYIQRFKDYSNSYLNNQTNNNTNHLTMNTPRTNQNTDGASFKFIKRGNTPAGYMTSRAIPQNQKQLQSDFQTAISETQRKSQLYPILQSPTKRSSNIMYNQVVREITKKRRSVRRNIQNVYNHTVQQSTSLGMGGGPGSISSLIKQNSGSPKNTIQLQQHFSNQSSQQQEQ